MKIAMMLGLFSSRTHGQIDVRELFEHRALTGSESSFFNTARGLSELGHHVDVFCDVVEPVNKCDKLSGANVFHISNDPGSQYDAYISLNEPDQLRRVPSNSQGLRVVHQQLNDFAYCMNDWHNFVDILAFVSPVQRDNILPTAANFTKDKVTWVPNSINLEFSQQFSDLPRKPHSMVWCSSPDRGLHHLLEIFPEVRKQVPDATLEIYYRFQPWYDNIIHTDLPAAAAARSIGDSLQRLGRNGENGVTLIGPIPNVQLAQVLATTQILPYTCDCTSFTEGFSVSTMDACAAGAIPIISDIDAIGDIYRNYAVVMPAFPQHHKDQWVQTIVGLMRNPEERARIAAKSVAFSHAFSRQKVAKVWEALLLKNLKNRDTPSFDHMPVSIEQYVARRIPTCKKSPPSLAPDKAPPSEPSELLLDLRDALESMDLHRWITRRCETCQVEKSDCPTCNRRRAFVGQYLGRNF